MRHQRLAWVGRFRSKTTEPKNNSKAVWIIIKKVTSKALPMKYEETDIGVPRKRFRVPSSRSIGIVIASC